MMAAIDNHVRAVATKSKAPMKRFRFVFELGNGVSFGGDFECLAKDERDAWGILNRLMPGARDFVKKLSTLAPVVN